MKAEARKQPELPEETVASPSIAPPSLTYAEAPAEFGPALPVKILRLADYTDAQGLSAQSGVKRMDAGAPANQTRYLVDYFPKAGLFRVVFFASGAYAGKTSYIERSNVKSWDPEG